MALLGASDSPKDGSVRRRVRSLPRSVLRPPPPPPRSTTAAAAPSVTFSPIVGLSSVSGSRRITEEAHQQQQQQQQQRTATATAGLNTHIITRRYSLPGERPIPPPTDDGAAAAAAAAAPAGPLYYAADVALETPPLPGWPPSHAFLMEMEKSAGKAPEKRRSWQRGPLLPSPRNRTALAAATTTVVVEEKQQPEERVLLLPGLKAHHSGGDVSPGLTASPGRGTLKLGGDEEEDGPGGRDENLQPSPAGTEIVSDFSSTGKSANAASTLAAAAAAAAAGGTLRRSMFSNNNENDANNGGGGGGGGGDWGGWSGFAPAKRTGDCCDEDSSSSTQQEEEADAEAEEVNMSASLCASCPRDFAMHTAVVASGISGIRQKHYSSSSSSSSSRQ